MKTKWIFGIVVVIMILSIFSISQGADKFYFGSYGGIEHAYMLKDSLKFNIIEQVGVNESNIGSLVDGGLRAIVAATGENNPTHWAWFSHYTPWEAEPYPGSNVNLQYASWGTLVDDPSASGGKAMKFSGPGTPGIIQWGPTYYQERAVNELPQDTIKYTAEFRLRFIYSLYQPLGPRGPDPPPNPKVCSLMVMDTVSHSILKDTVLYKSDFPGGGIGPYQIFELKDYTVPGSNRIEFQIYWFGIAGNLYIDYVKVYDENGERLMSGERDTAIMNYVSQSWVGTTIPGTGDTVVYRWYGRDQPPSIDLYMPHVYIDSLLKEVSQERIVNQTLNRIWKPEKVFCNKRK